ncbi:MAG: preprotein translocase subunit YajC [Deltaproteobacteria bacterium]|nr:preprotein translocase subunit YajC [Deltaproteobacteria bacterium]
MMLLMFGVIYFMLIRPQSKKRKEHQSWLDGLQRGDTVVTQGGIIGKITGVADKVVTIEVAHDVRMRVLRSHILGPESMASSSQGREEAKPQQKAK